MSGSIDIPVISKFDPTGLKKAQDGLDAFKGSVGKIAGVVAAAFSVGAIVNFGKEAILAAEGVATANARIQQIAKSTGVFGAATTQVTDRLIALAEANELRLAVDAEVIKGVQGQLLSFKELSATATTAGGVFDRVTEAAFNMAAAGFGSAESNAIALGKAFEDPVRGLTALRRSGTVFTEEQQKLIKSMVDAGNVAGAQEVILKELESQYGGVAEATANASTKFQLLFDNIKESVGAELLPIFNDLFVELEPIITDIAGMMADVFKELAPTFRQLLPVISALLQSFTPLLPVIGQLAELFANVLIAVLPIFVELMNRLIPIIVMVMDALMPIVEAILPIFVSLLEMALTVLLPIIEAVLPIFVSLFQTLAPIILEVISAFLPLVEELLPLFMLGLELALPVIQLFADMLGVVLPAAFAMLQELGLLPSAEAIGAWAQGLGDVIGAIRGFFIGAMNNMIQTLVNAANGFIGTINRIIREGKRLPGALGAIYRGLPTLNTIEFTPISIEMAPFNLRQSLDQMGVRDVVSDYLRYGTRSQNVLDASGFAGISRTYTGTNRFDASGFAGVVPQLAAGGVVNRATLAIIGEAGPEAVIPLDEMGRMGSTYNITVNAGMGVDGARLGEQIVSAIRKYERASGPVFASA